MCHGPFKTCKQENGQIHHVRNVSELSSQRLNSRADAMHNYTQTRHLKIHAMLFLKYPNWVQFQKISIPIPWLQGWGLKVESTPEIFHGGRGIWIFFRNKTTGNRDRVEAELILPDRVQRSTSLQKGRYTISKGWFPLVHKQTYAHAVRCW